MLCDLPGEKLRLVEAAGPLFPPVQGNGNDRVKRHLGRNHAVKKTRQRSGKRAHPGILEQMNQGPERPGIEAKTRRIIESKQSGAASGADTLFVQWERVLKWSVTNRTEIFGVQRDRRFEARRADRNARPFV